MEIMPILERKIAHKMTTLCSHITYPEFVLPLHKHAEYELMIFTHGSGKQFVGESVAPYAEGFRFIHPHLTAYHPVPDSRPPASLQENATPVINSL